ncbi:MAG: M3 family metallopeptidase, partial [Oscillospiraceae bacterium]|nr:M3 family metallopeptidase [Oscillospiraceae bacterium]
YYSLYYSEDDVSEDLADIYLKSLDNVIESNEINGYGFPDYAQYAYEKGFQRDFSPEEAQELYAWTRELIVPWFMQSIYTIQMSYGQQLNEYYSMDMTEDEIVSRVKPYVTTVSEKAAEAFECMQENHLFDLAASETKNEGAFTTSINWYGVPFIFSQHEGSASDAETLVHEFGHAYEGYVNAMPVMYEYACIDIAEIDSQGMEMLMMKNAADIFGEDVAETAELMSLYHVFTGVIDGCIFDEFQQRALQGRMDGSIQTTADLTELFLSIEESYYGKGVYNWGEQWMMVPHTFESPFYYISYATSATAALGILAISQENYDEAVSMYNELVDYGNNNGFMETLDVIGLPNPLTEAGQQIITENLTPFFYQMFGLDAE